MLIQSFHPCSIEDDLCFASDLGVKGYFFDWMPAAVKWQMDSKSEMITDVRCEEIASFQKNDAGCSLSHIQSCNTSECSPNFVYRRRKLLKNRPPLSRSSISAKTSLDNINFVYERRKHQKSGLSNFSSVVSASTSPNGACSSATRSQDPVPLVTDKTRGIHEKEASRGSSMSAIASNKELPSFASDTVNGCSFIVRGSDSKEKMNKAIELYSVDDSCSSSILNTDEGLAASKTQVDDADECSSSGAHVTDVMRADLSLSVKDLCVSILQSHGLLSRSGPSEEDSPSCSGSSCARSCNVCNLAGKAVEMLICDECEEAFHLTCFNPSIKKIPADDWYCQSCAKKKHNLMKERAVRRSSIIGSGKDSVKSEGNTSAIELMLKDTEPYITGVRVGKGFQAIVPEWSGPMTEDFDAYPEPMELDLSHSVGLTGLNHSKCRKSGFIGNWLQCREVITGIGDGIDGTICGKWRRAPLYEVQTDKWDCFRSILWDPTYADCCVPQELETEEVLKQLKYIETLRPRLAAKRQKLGNCSVTGANDSPVPTEDASVETV